MIAVIDARQRASQPRDPIPLLPVLSMLLVLTSGCINTSMRLQPEDTSVKEVLQGSDCVAIVFGFGLGTATIEQAKADARPIDDPYGRSGVSPITKVRRVQFTEKYILFGGARCVEVVGE